MNFRGVHAFVYVPHGTSLERIPVEAGAAAAGGRRLDRPRHARPCRKTSWSSALLGIAVPTREEMQEIEVSSRLYVENGARYMTATLMCHSDTDDAEDHAGHLHPLRHRLVTVRYDEPRPFAIVEQKLARNCPAKVSGDTVMMDLLDAVIDRSADILERIGAEVDQVSHTIFEPEDDGIEPAILQGHA